MPRFFQIAWVGLMLAGSTAVPAAAFAQAPDPHLIPRPREIKTGSYVAIPRSVSISAAASGDDRFAATELANTLRDRGLRTSTTATATATATATTPTPTTGTYRVTLARADSPVGKQLLGAYALALNGDQRAEGYAIVSDKDQTVVVAASAAGIFYGVQTVKQLIRTDGTEPQIFTATIRDWPAMRWRGMQDDLSRGPLPTLEFQKRQIRIFAAYKLNVYSPYYEHTFEYKSHPLMAPPGGVMTQDEVKELIAYARPYHIDVVPEQEAFGHLHHMLKYDLYGQLAESPHGHVLAPGQAGSIEVIKEWFAEINAVFPSQFVHIGADETFELGRGQTRDRVQKESLGVVYMQFLKEIEVAIRRPGKRYLFWGDIAQESPQLVKSLPKDMIAVAWNYWSFSGFDRSIKPFSDAGIETWVAPGVNNWNRVFPNNDVALRNIQGFVRDGQRLGSTGMLNTNWDDDGEGLFNQTWYGVLFGATASWQKGEASIPEFTESFGLQFHGDPTGRIDAAQRKLSQAQALLAKSGPGEATTQLYWIDPFTPEGQIAAQRIRAISRDVRVLAESALVLVAQARYTLTGKEGALAALRERDALEAVEMGARRIDFIGMKFQLADEIVRHYSAALDSVAKGANPTQDLTEIASQINSRTQDLRDGYVLGRELYERSWKAENRPYWSYNVLNRFDIGAQTWIRRIDQFNQVRAQYNRTKKLPGLEEMGLPRPVTP